MGDVPAGATFTYQQDGVLLGGDSVDANDAAVITVLPGLPTNINLNVDANCEYDFVFTPECGESAYLM